jgi:hypothetical protein
MHSFATHCERATSALLSMISEREEFILKEMETSSATINIIMMRNCNYLRAFHVVGMFSTFEAVLQVSLWDAGSVVVKDPFGRVQEILIDKELSNLLESFKLIRDSVNSLKHGYGRSYEKLLHPANLPFKIKRPDEAFFDEGDVSEIDTLVQVDNEFVMRCVDVIRDVSRVLGLTRG